MQRYSPLSHPSPTVITMHAQLKIFKTLWNSRKNYIIRLDKKMNFPKIDVETGINFQNFSSFFRKIPKTTWLFYYVDLKSYWNLRFGHWISSQKCHRKKVLENFQKFISQEWHIINRILIWCFLALFQVSLEMTIRYFRGWITIKRVSSFKYKTRQRGS